MDTYVVFISVAINIEYRGLLDILTSFALDRYQLMRLMDCSVDLLFIGTGN